MNVSIVIVLKRSKVQVSKVIHDKSPVLSPKYPLLKSLSIETFDLKNNH